MGSVASCFPGADRELYPSTKKFVEYLSNAFHYRFGSDIDYVVTKPGFVETKMTNFRSGRGCCNSMECVKGAMLALGNTNETYGAKNHVVLGRFIESYTWMFPPKVANVFLHI